MQSLEGNVVWADPLFIMPWALHVITAGGKMNTEIVGDDEDETRSVSRASIRISTTILIGRMYLILYIVS